MPQNGSGQPTLITLHDAVTDSPVYRANVLHFDEQVDLLEKWLDSLSRHLKQYTDKLNKFNLETNNVCKRTIPTGIDDTLIDSNFTGAVIRSFSDALQTSLAFKTKLVSDLEDNFIQPLAQFVKTHLKEYKEFRKQHEKALERYEAQLYKYTSQSKTKEASALREEAFRLHEARKQYSRMSGQHVIRILQFRSQLEHCLVDSFSSATLAHMHECEGGQQVWQKLDASLVSWKQWLIDDRNTCNYQLHNLYTARQQLQAEFLQKVHPPRDLEKYVPLGTVPAGSSMGSRQSLDFTMTQSDENHPSFKWGYLFTRVSRLSWTRKWFFLFDGYFGTCHIHTTGKLKGAITVTEKVSVLLCDIKPIVDGDRRFCFEIVCAQQPSFVLQAETEEEMREWMGAFVSAKRSSVDSEHMNNKDSPRPSSPANERVSDASSISLATTNGSVEQHDSSVVMLSTSYDKGNISLSTSTSLTPLLVCEAARQQINASSSSSMPNSSATPNQSVTSSIINSSAQNNNSNSSNSNASSSWGIPWTLVPSMFSAGSSDDSDRSPASPMSPTFPSTTGASEYDGHPVVWPLRTDDNNAPKTNMTGYTTVLETRNSELRNLFGGVSPSEVVVEAFIGSLKKKPTTQEDEKVPSPTTPTTSADASEQELSAQLAGPAAPPTSEFGYAYTGRVFVTQDTFWFYSCVLMTCVNTVAVRLKDIKNIRLIRDQSASETIGKNGKPRNIVLAIDLVQSNQSPLIISTLLDDIEVVAERLRIAVESAKSSRPMPLQVMYDVMRNISASAGKNKSNQKTTISKTEHHPLKAHSTPDLHAASNAVPSASSSTTTTTTSNTADIYHPEPVGSPIPDKKKRKPRKSSGSNKPVPKTGALAAAMMAATVAGGSGFFDVDKITKLEEAAKQKPDSSVSDPPIELGAIEPKDASVPKTSTPVDTTHSAPEDTTAIPPGVQIPSGPCACDCDSHLDKTETEVQLSVSAKQLFELMFAEGSNDIWEAKLAAAGGNGLRMGKWENVNGKQQRSLKYILPVNNPMVKLKEAEVAETQVLLKKEDYIRYVVQISTKTAQLPYADAFIPSIRYCITWVSKSECKLRCSLGVQFVKSILVKGMVNKAATKGMSESIASFIPILEKKVSKEGGKSSTSTSSSSTLSSTVEANDSKQQSAMETAVKKDAYTKQNSIDEWIDTLRNFVLDVPWHAYMAILGLLFLWMLSAWLRSGSSKDDVPHTLLSHPPPNRVTSRAVYLKDLQEGLIQPHPDEIPYANSESFQYFLANGTVDASHQWYNSNHHRMALELLFSRERVAMLRHDMLVIFQLLNQVDARLLEHEYVNWMLDTRLWCHKPNYTPPHQFCEQIQRQLQTYFK